MVSPVFALLPLTLTGLSPVVVKRPCVCRGIAALVADTSGAASAKPPAAYTCKTAAGANGPAFLALLLKIFIGDLSGIWRAGKSSKPCEVYPRPATSANPFDG